MKYRLERKESVGFWVAVALMCLVFVALGVWLMGWLLSMALGWFGVKLAVWQCCVIWLLISAIGGAFKATVSK